MLAEGARQPTGRFVPQDVKGLAAARRCGHQCCSGSVDARRVVVAVRFTVLVD
jgi:hypothetical protein